MNDPLHRTGNGWGFDIGNWPRNRQLAAGAGAAVLVVALVVGLLVGLSGSTHPPAAADKHGTTNTTTPNSTTGTTGTTSSSTQPPRKPSTDCPLTGLPAPRHVVPQRPALAVKVGNDPDARPQSGLADADIVVDTLAEGGIVRYIAIFQCHTSSAIGPIRSVRWTDWHILQELGHVDLAFVHGIDPDVNTVKSIGWICDLDEFTHGGAYFVNPNRVPPEATYATTAALWASCPKHSAPPPLFTYSGAKPAGGIPVSQAELAYNGYESDVIWQWSASKHAWMHAYREGGAIVPDVDDRGIRLSATNVVIEEVHITVGPYSESPGGPGDQESQTVGSGRAWILRDGRAYEVMWKRPELKDITQYIGANGKPFPLQPGTTWLELYPTSPTAPAPAFTH